jgi:hypothetical protein
LQDFDGERKKGREEESEELGNCERHFYNGGGGTKTVTLLEDSQAPPPRLSGTNCMKMELYEDGKKRMYRMVRVVV